MHAQMKLDRVTKHCELSPIHCEDIEGCLCERTLQSIPRVDNPVEELLPLHLAKDRNQPLLICSLHNPLDDYTTILSNTVLQLGFECFEIFQQITNPTLCSVHVAPSHGVATWTYMPQQL